MSKSGSWGSRTFQCAKCLDSSKLKDSRKRPVIYTFPLGPPRSNAKNPCATHLSHPFGCGSPHPKWVMPRRCNFPMAFQHSHRATPSGGGCGLCCTSLFPTRFDKRIMIIMIYISRSRLYGLAGKFCRTDILTNRACF